MTDVQKQGQEGVRQRQQQNRKGESEHPAAEQLIRETKAGAQQAYAKVCQTCNQLGSFPKVTTVLLLLSAFLLGIGVTALAGRMGYFVPSTGHFTRDQTAIDAHAALDTLLVNMNHYKGAAQDSYDNAKGSAAKAAAKMALSPQKLSAAKELLLTVLASKAGSWKDDLAAKAQDYKNAAYEAAGNVRDAAGNVQGRAQDLANDAKEAALNAARRAGLAKEPVHEGLGDKIKDAIHNVRDAANDAYYQAKGKVMGEAVEIEEGTVKRVLHKAENKIKDALHMN